MSRTQPRSSRISTKQDSDPIETNTSTEPLELQPTSDLSVDQPSSEQDDKKLVSADSTKIVHPEAPTMTKPDIHPDDPMSEAGRKILRFYFAKMLAAEPIAREGSDPEGVHDMRVATRRMRSVAQLFRPYFNPSVLKPILKHLRQVAEALGAVRDLDVAYIKTQKYIKAQGEDATQGLGGLLDQWNTEVTSARGRLNHLLDGSKYAAFLTELSRFVSTANYGALPFGNASQPFPYLVKHVVPRLIYEKFEAVRAYEPILVHAPLDTLHALRIEAKRLRYALESFEEVLAPDAKIVITATKVLQDHLGDLQDARVASAMMYEYLRGSGEAQPQAATLHYLTNREEEKTALLNAVSEVWATFMQPEVRRSLALAVADL